MFAPSTLGISSEPSVYGQAELDIWPWATLLQAHNTQQKPPYETVNTAPVLLGMNGTVLPVLALAKSHFR